MPHLLLWLVALLPRSAAPPDSLRPLSPAHRLAYAYANDFFFGTDYYFTQGMTLDVVSPALARLPTRCVLLRGPVGSTDAYGVAVRYDGFTPTRITDGFVRVGDRPYAAYYYAALYRVSNQARTRQRLTAALEVGYLGPAAGGKFIQTKLHELTGGPVPRGWDYQIRSDAVLGYRVTYERQVLAAGRIAELLGSAEASLGTLYTYASVGGQLRVGRWQPYFANPGATDARRWQLYAEATGAGQLVGYDATLQGGLLNRTSPYTLVFGEVKHAVWHSSGALVAAYHGLCLRAAAVYVGPEFAGGRSHRWGVLALARTF